MCPSYRAEIASSNRVRYLPRVTERNPEQTLAWSRPAIERVRDSHDDSVMGEEGRTARISAAAIVGGAGARTVSPSNHHQCTSKEIL